MDHVYLIWLGGASCDGCTVSVTGGTRPRFEQLLVGAIPGIPKVELVHSDFSIESGEAWINNLVLAQRAELDAPYVLTWEGSVMDESRAGTGYWGGLGRDPQDGRQLTSRDWLDRLAPGAAATVAIGTCASWGGIPAAAGSPTGATGVGKRLGPSYRSRLGLPLITVPGCAPAGDDYLETLLAVLLYANGLGPEPELDALGRPAWLFGHSVPEGSGGSVPCNMEAGGAVGGYGGCASMGGICISCTLPGFPDRLAADRSGPEPAPPSARRCTKAVSGRAAGVRPAARFWQVAQRRRPPAEPAHDDPLRPCQPGLPTPQEVPVP